MSFMEAAEGNAAGGSGDVRGALEHQAQSGGEGSGELPYLAKLKAEKRELEAALPGWEIWFVEEHATGTVTWCARRRDGTGQTLNAGSPAGLLAAAAGAES
jgi:hypothetical protein